MFINSNRVKGTVTMKNQLKRSIEEHAFNEDKMLLNILNSAKLEGILPPHQKKRSLSRTLKYGLSFVLVLTLVLIGLTQQNHFNPKDPNTITAIYTLDINPSFKISVNKTELVISIIAQNEDAAQVNVKDLLGKDSALVLEELIKRSEKAGFIDTKDLVDDYVLISAIPMNQEDQNQINGIDLRIKEQTKNSSYLQNLNIAIIRTSLEKLELANQKNIPVGLYVINEMINQTDKPLLECRQFFVDPQNRTVFQTKGDIKDEKINRIKARILVALNKLDKIGLDTTEVKTHLISAKDQDLSDIQKEVLKLLVKYHLGSVTEVIISSNENI